MEWCKIFETFKVISIILYSQVIVFTFDYIKGNPLQIYYPNVETFNWFGVFTYFFFAQALLYGVVPGEHTS